MNDDELASEWSAHDMTSVQRMDPRMQSTRSTALSLSLSPDGYNCWTENQIHCRIQVIPY